jgi:hypothetical protein
LHKFSAVRDQPAARHPFFEIFAFFVVNHFLRVFAAPPDDGVHQGRLAGLDLFDGAL